MTDALLRRNSCGWYIYMIIDYVFMKTLPILKKRATKIGAPNFRPSHYYSSVVQTASNWNLQKLLKSEL